jgi:hypothetical protein
MNYSSTTSLLRTTSIEEYVKEMCFLFELASIKDDEEMIQNISEIYLRNVKNLSNKRMEKKISMRIINDCERGSTNFIQFINGLRIILSVEEDIFSFKCIDYSDVMFCKGIFRYLNGKGYLSLSKNINYGLISACFQGNMELVSFFYDNDIEKEKEENINNFFALWSACFGEKIEIVEYLFDNHIVESDLELENILYSLNFFHEYEDLENLKETENVPGERKIIEMIRESNLDVYNYLTSRHREDIIALMIFQRIVVF